MKHYSVSVQVFAHVVVYVEAENEEEAVEIAEREANLNDAQPIDFSTTGTEAIEIEAKEKPSDEKVLQSMAIEAINNKTTRN